MVVLLNRVFDWDEEMTAVGGRSPRSYEHRRIRVDAGALPAHLLSICTTVRADTCRSIYAGQCC